MIVDDSALMRNLIGKKSNRPGLRIAEKAMNGRFALQKIARAKPDIIVLDIEMPEIERHRIPAERKKLGIDIPVVILSSIAKEGARVTMECLELGASDFVTKPSGSESADLHTVAKQLVEMLSCVWRQYQLKKNRGNGETDPGSDTAYLRNRGIADTEHAVYEPKPVVLPPIHREKSQTAIPAQKTGTHKETRKHRNNRHRHFDRRTERASRGIREARPDLPQRERRRTAYARGLYRGIREQPEQDLSP
jgi:two-component system chemotaxis response regulator CheB